MLGERKENKLVSTLSSFQDGSLGVCYLPKRPWQGWTRLGQTGEQQEVVDSSLIKMAIRLVPEENQERGQHPGCLVFLTTRRLIPHV